MNGDDHQSLKKYHQKFNFNREDRKNLTKHFRNIRVDRRPI